MSDDNTQPPHGSESDPPKERRQSRRRTVLSLFGWGRRLARLWGFLGFVILVVILARHVILPFIFALLIAYVLGPIVDWMARRPDGNRRMPRGLAILVCYLVLLSVLASFVGVLMPRISKDAARIGREAPALYKKLNDEWAPQVGLWLEDRFPSMKAPEPDRGDLGGHVAEDGSLPPGTAFVVTPLPDGRMAVRIPPSGVELEPRPGGGFHLTTREETRTSEGIEDKLRAWINRALASLQSQIGDFFRFGQAVIIGLIRSVFSFFLVLMVAAFLLIDMAKLRGFVRGLVPEGSRGDYDVIAAGINRGLSGVIRGQLLICVINGVLTYVGLILIGVNYALLLAVVAAVMSLIPIFGSILSTLPIVLAALVSGEEGLDILRATLSVGWIVLIHFIEANFLNPKIIGTAAKIHPVLVIFALIVGEHSYGLVGALLAVPVMSMIQVLFIFFRNKAWRTEAARAARTSRSATSPTNPPDSTPDSDSGGVTGNQPEAT